MLSSEVDKPHTTGLADGYLTVANVVPPSVCALFAKSPRLTDRCGFFRALFVLVLFILPEGRSSSES